MGDGGEEWTGASSRPRSLGTGTQRKLKAEGRTVISF